MRSGKSFYYILSIYLILCYGSVFAQSDWAIISLVVNGIPKGDIECQLEGNEITLPTKQVLNIIRPYLSSHYFAIIGEIKTDYLTLENLSFLGLPTQFDAASLTVHIQIPPQFMTEKSLGSEEKPQLKMTQILKPAQVSAFLNGNVVFGIKKNSELPPYMIGSLNIDGALNIYGWVSEAETAFILDQSVKTELRNLRLIHDFRNIGVRLSVGTVDLPQTGFQSRFNVAGIAIGSNQESLLLPDQSSITERRKPSILKDSDFIVVNNTAKILVSVNGITIRNTTVGPGRYRIGDLPLASGLNNVVIKIEEEGKPPIEQHIGIPYEEALLSQQDFRFAFGMGMTTDDMIAPIGSAFFRYGITDTLEAGVNIQGGFGVLLGGISLKLATFLGYFYGDGAIKVSYNDGGLIYTPAYNSSLQYRLNLPYQPYIPRFGLSFQYMSSGFSPPQIINTTTSLIPSWKVAAQIAQATPVGISLALLGDYSSNSGNAGSFSTAIGLSMPFGKETTFSASFAIDNRLGYWLPQASLSLLVIPGTGKTTSHVYQSLINGETGIEVAWNSGNKTRDYNGSVSVTNPVEAGTSPRSINANLKRTGALIDWGTQFWYRDNRDGTEPGYGGTFSTEGSIVYADGIPAFSHRVFDSFAILKPDTSLQQEVVTMATGVTSQTRSEKGKAAVLPTLTAYKDTFATIQLPQAPADITTNITFVTIQPTYKSGIIVQPSIRKTILVTGTLIDSVGEPIAWALGTANNTGQMDNLQKTSIFTDEKGYFEAYLEVGNNYVIEWNTKPVISVQFTIPQGTEQTYKLGIINQTEREDNHR